jgi:uncharacterized protein YjbI with pentapeptide repeats
MDRDEALRLLQGGREGIAEWNRRRSAGEEIPDLDGADFIRADLVGANLSGADLSRATLRDANLNGADLVGANLSRARCWGTIFVDLDLSVVSEDY